MGSEFLKNTRATFVKSIDTGRVELGTPDLFTQTPQDSPRCAVAKIRPGTKLEAGETLIVEPDGTELVASRGTSEVARFKNPPADILQAVNTKGSVAMGEVQKINSISNTADISIC